MDKSITLIKNTTLMCSLSIEDIKTYVTSGQFRLVSYNKNNVIHFEGDACNKLEIILVGSVAVERIDESGNLLVISEFFNDDILGGNLIFSSEPLYPLTITAKEPTTILEIDKALLFLLFTSNHALLQKFLEFISDHAFILNDKIRHYIKRTIRESVVNYLKQLSIAQNSKHIALKISKKALAEKIGVERTSLSRELAKMRKDKLITYDANYIDILF